MTELDQPIRVSKLVQTVTAEWLIKHKRAEYKPSNQDDKHMLLWRGIIYKKCDKGYEPLR